MRTRAALLTDLRRCAKSLRDAEALSAKRNRLWAEAVAAGFTPAEIGEIFQVEAQTVRWNLNRANGKPPDLSKAVHRRARAG